MVYANLGSFDRAKCAIAETINETHLTDIFGGDISCQIAAMI